LLHRGQMKTIQSPKEMQLFAQNTRSRNQKISFVPTMGYLHEGHLQLMREGRKKADCLVVSIYVNPTQFGAGEDFERYPRAPERDSKLAESVGVDVMFYPTNTDMYPADYQTLINVEGVTENLCGLSRPGHFRGVATICCKLFNIVKPHMAIFGKKDFQQFVVIKRMVEDLNMDIEIIGMPTVRESDGLAMSSRNVYLNREERKVALSLSRSLLLAQELFKGGLRNAAEILKAVTETLEENPILRLEYAKICDVKTLRDLQSVDGGSVLALAAYVGKTRLIDNHVFGELLEI